MLPIITTIIVLTFFAQTVAYTEKNIPYESTLKPNTMQTIIHNAHLSEGWYTHNANNLNQELDNYLTLATNNFAIPLNQEKITALVVPHAGYYYSGLCAATAYQSLLQKPNTYCNNKNTSIKKVIILAPSHTHYFKGIALPDYTEYHNCFGTIPVDTTTINQLAKHPLCTLHPQAHAAEHAIEMQLPFLQKTIAQFTIIPLIVGNIDKQSATLLAEQINNLIDAATLIVVTSDFVHHGPNFRYTLFNTHITDQIKELDSTVIKPLIQQHYDNFYNALEHSRATVCGKNPLLLLLELLTSKKLDASTAHLACYYTSNHIKKAKAQLPTLHIPSLYESIPDCIAREGSVSYASIIFTEQKKRIAKQQHKLSAYEKQSLLTLARRTLTNTFTQEEHVPEELLLPILTPELEKIGGVFVTLTTPQGSLRGCIGKIISTNPRYQEIKNMVKAAAFNDHRFKPLTHAELATTNITITLLTPPQKIASPDAIELGKHGIILNKQGKNGIITHSSVFLPNVPTKMGWNLTTTLNQLSLKAGLNEANAWQNDCFFQIFEGLEIKERIPTYGN